MLKFDPTVFAAGKDYEIFVTTKRQSFISLIIGGREYVDSSNGILRSSERTHRFYVPMEELDKAGAYTVVERNIIKRLPYFTKMGKTNTYDYKFYPVPAENAACYHIADAHNSVDKPVACAGKAGKTDFLILNGDIPNHSGDIKYFDAIFDISARITHGEKPVVFSRGNHDLRGIYGEKFEYYTPQVNGRSYFTFRLGSIWGICLDCGEDKPDSNEEYGTTVACHRFREEETAFLEDVVKRAGEEYAAEGVKTRICVCHVPFTHKFPSPFDIEPEIYTRWAGILENDVHADIMICGHTHHYEFLTKGDEYDAYGHPCPVVVGAYNQKDGYGGASFTFRSDRIDVRCNLTDGKVRAEKSIMLKR